MADSGSRKRRRSRAELRWKRGLQGVRGIDPGEVAKELDRIRAESGGVVTAAQLVKQSRRKRALLHSAFEWDDDHAAELYREVQARKIIAGIEIVHDGVVIGPRMVNVVIKEVGRGYVPIDVAISREDTREQLIIQAVRDLDAWQRRYEHLSEFTEIFRAIESMRDG